MPSELWAVMVVAAVFFTYVASLYLHPWVDCSRCGGSAKHRGLLFPYAHRPCDKCGGTSKRPRWGRRFIFGPPK